MSDDSNTAVREGVRKGITGKGRPLPGARGEDRCKWIDECGYTWRR